MTVRDLEEGRQQILCGFRVLYETADVFWTFLRYCAGVEPVVSRKLWMK